MFCVRCQSQSLRHRAMQHSQSLATPNPELAINVHVVEYFVQETTERLSTYPTTTIFADITARPNPGRSRFERTGRPGKLAAAARSEHTQPTPVPPSVSDQPAQGPNQNSTHRKTSASSFKSATTVCQLSGQIPLDMLP
ncbi:hypothetical protein FOPG_18332 [Fusarium oxysporum f. sp. conglutinans race 2 54008]|uniref:Uncharacterized protein n=1 Tax=Fusarium oxysporum f. sp. conglutinans race 2 54008 TaxID=1089457 RepID=X0GQ54_FUSOX|nr:hypothetical protein FOPG_18332 [Fusarium oxysporum f. sp. conglutinans race 2 54008]